MQKVYYAVVSLLAIILILVTGKYVYESYKSDKPEMVNQQQTTVIIPTLEQRLNDWAEEKRNTEMYNLCMELPEQIVKTILKRIGTSATYEEIAEEYLRNTSYYISMQIRDNMPGIIGPDSKNAKVEIKTEVTRPEREQDKPMRPSISVVDSIK